MSWFRRGPEPVDEDTLEMERMAAHASQLHGVPVREVVDTVMDEDYDEDEIQKRSFNYSLWVTLVVVGAAFGLAIVGLMKLANSADQAGPTTDQAMAQVQKSIAPTPAALPSFTGQFIAFSYPSAFDAVKTMDNLPTTAERYSIGSKADYRRSIMIMVENNTPTLEDDSGYKFRTLSEAVYHPEPIKVAKEAAVVMVKNDGTEQTLYWAYAGKVVVMSFTSTNGKDNLADYVATVAGSLRWTK